MAPIAARILLFSVLSSAGLLQSVEVPLAPVGERLGEMIRNPATGLPATPPTEVWKVELLARPIRAFCIDFNWQVKRNDLWFAEPGHWGDAEPAAHVKWYKDLGANCIQTFVLSCNGFAAPYDNSLPLPVAEYLTRPIDDSRGTARMTINDRNIAALARFYPGKPAEPPPGTGLAADKPATASSVWGPGYGAERAFDGDESTRWGAAPNTRSGWLEVDLGQETQLGRAVVMELGYHRTQDFAIEYKAGESWKELVHGTTIAGRRTFGFPPVKARYARRDILKADEVPTIE